MKQLFFIITFSLAALFAIAQEPTPATIQTPADVTTVSDTIPVFPNPVNPTVSVEWLINAENGLYAGLLFVLSFLSFVIPGINRIPEKIVRTLAIGASLLVLFIGYRAVNGQFDIGQIISLVISYLVTTGAYDKIFKPLGLTTPQGATGSTKEAQQ